MSASKIRAPGTNLQTIEPMWSLTKWGNHIIGKLPLAQGNFQNVVVAL